MIWILYSVAASLIHPRVMIQGVITTPSMSKHVDGFGRTTFHRYVLHTSCFCCYALCAHLYLVLYPDPLQSSKRRVCFETNLKLYHALMTRPASYVVMHTCTQLTHTRKLGLEGVGGGEGGGEGGGGDFSIVKMSDQFILSTKSVHPVYAESWTTCLQLQNM